jgi:hypothetical protein
MNKKAFSVFQEIGNWRKTSFATGKMWNESLLTSLFAQNVSFATHEKVTPRFAMIWMRHIGPELGRCSLGLGLVTAFWACTWTRLFRACNWTRLFGPGLGSGILGVQLEAAFLAWNWSGFLGPVFDEFFRPGLGFCFMDLDLSAAFWAWNCTRLFGPVLGRGFLGLDLEAAFWAWT